jgi:hydroxypyruvate isomerase
LLNAEMLSRRTALQILAATSAATAFAEKVVAKGHIKQSVIPWCFNPMPVPELAEHAAALGLLSVELCDPNHWPRLKELGLTCAIAGSHGFAKGFAHKEEWAECHKALRERIEQCAAFGVERGDYVFRLSPRALRTTRDREYGRRLEGSRRSR